MVLGYILLIGAVIFVRRTFNKVSPNEQSSVDKRYIESDSEDIKCP